MIPASINISFDKGSDEGDMTVVALVRGTRAEVATLRIELGAKKVDSIGRQNLDVLVAVALRKMAERLERADIEYTTLAENRGLPEHMLRVVNELAELEVRMDALAKFTGIETGMPPTAFQMLLRYQKADLAQQLGEMQTLANTYRRRLKRARAEIAQ